MAADNRFSIAVGAIDEASPIFNKVKSALGGLNKPIGEAQSSFKRLSDSPAFDSIGKSIASIGKGAQDSVGWLSALVPGLGTIAAIGSVAGIANFERDWTNRGAAIWRTSQAIGINTTALQRWEGAARIAGASADAADQSLSTLGATMNSAEFGREDKALGAMASLGIITRRTKEGAVDVNDAMMQLSATFDATRKGPGGVQGAENLMNTFGLGALVPLLLRGHDEVKRLGDAWEASGAIMSTDAAQGASDLYGKLTLLEGSVEGVGNAIGTILTPALGGAIDKMTALVSAAGQMINTPGGSKFGAGILKSDPVFFLQEMLAHLNPFDTAPAGSAPVATPYAGNGASVNETMRALGNNRGAFLRETMDSGGKVAVDINIRGAAPGTVASLNQSGNVNASARVEHAMPNSGP